MNNVEKYSIINHLITANNVEDITIETLEKITKGKTIITVCLNHGLNKTFFIEQSAKNDKNVILYSIFNSSELDIANELVKKAEKEFFSVNPKNSRITYYHKLVALNRKARFEITKHSKNESVEARNVLLTALLLYLKKNPYINYAKTQKQQVTKKNVKKSKVKSSGGGRLRQRTFSNKKSTQDPELFQKEITTHFFEMLLMIKLYHWNTRIYATHKATDQLYSKFNDHMDTFIEVLLGKTGVRIEMHKEKTVKLIDISNESELIRRINAFKEYLIDLNKNKYLSVMFNADLFTIRDEILGDMNQFLYLLSFK